ncbi:WW domain-binding protein 11-like [Corythoichthys intestinalis]|uniref:WW domain-binding protein 11-like n=1 Tax=Corythoichthys intestinalis TaxID=161448 RepID=UPI0025A5AD71|nr:WW domain-binding protein 11-like [Corythoichthys intestinalis]
MHSERPEYGQRPHHGYRDRRWRDDYHDQTEDRREYHRDVQRDSYRKHGSGRTERSSISTDYSDSPQKYYSKDSMDRDGDRRSPLRGRLSSPDRWGAEKNRRRFPDDSRGDYSYRYPTDDAKYMQNSRSWHRSDAFPSRHYQPYDSNHRQQCTYKNESDRNNSHSLETKLSPNYLTKSHVKSRERKESSPTDHHRARNYMDGSKRQSYERNPDHDVPEKKLSNGFQRFLDVLNRGVDVDVLNHIVIQTPAQDGRQTPSFSDVLDRPCFPGEQKRLGSLSPKRRYSCDDTSVMEREAGLGCTKFTSPPAVEKKPLTPEEAYKQQQIQGVLQAIGVDLGFEELGQMSHRINERLYGKKDGSLGCQRTGSRERLTRPAYSPRRHSRSSSSSSGKSKSNAFLDSQTCKIQETIPPNATIPPFRFPMLPSPAYGPVSSSPILYPPVLPNIPNVGPRLFFPPLPPWPGPPPYLPNPCLSPFNILPPVLPQTRDLLPPPQKPSKMQPRNRCLLEIDTKKSK